MNKQHKYKQLPIGAKKEMRLMAILVMIVATAILGTAGIILWNGALLPGFPGRRIIAVVLFVVVGIIDIYELLSPGIRYRQYRYFIDEEEINIHSGVIIHTTEVMPIERIHKIETTSGPIDRHFKLCSVNIYTAGGEIDINFLPVEEAEEIADVLKKKVNAIVLAQREAQ